MADGKYIVIDEAKGLENFGGDVDDYREIMEMTADACDDDIEELMGYYGAKDIENFVIKVHGMKSQSYYVGGTNIGDFAKSLEFAGKENRIDFIDSNVSEFTEAYKEFVGALRAYLG